MFAFEHGGIVLTSLRWLKADEFVPPLVVWRSAMRSQNTQENVFWGGLTYNAHCLGLATAEAVLQVFEDEGLVENSRVMGEVMRGHMQRMKDTHPSVRSLDKSDCLG